MKEITIIIVLINILDYNLGIEIIPGPVIIRILKIRKARNTFVPQWVYQI